MGLENHEHNRPNRQVGLVCRFKARTDQGRAYTIEGWAGFGFPFCDEEPARIELRTDRGVKIERLAKGRYRIGRPGTNLTSDDPAAV